MCLICYIWVSVARTDRLKRLRAELWMLEESPEGLTAWEIAEELGVSKRTAQRDLLTLRASGHPLSSVGGRWRFIEGGALPSALASDGAGGPNERDIVLRLDRAVRGRRLIEITHLGLDDLGPVRLYLAPLRLHYIDGSLFLVAREHRSGPFRTVAVERLAELRLLKGRVSADAARGLEGYLKKELRTDAAADLIRVIVRVNAGSARRVIERTWHPSQRTVVDTSGVAYVTFRVPGFAWVKAWALGFGEAAIAIEPPELVAEICNELDRARREYCELDAKLPQLDLFRERK